MVAQISSQKKTKQQKNYRPIFLKTTYAKNLIKQNKTENKRKFIKRSFNLINEVGFIEVIKGWFNTMWLKGKE